MNAPFQQLRVVTTAGWLARDLATGTDLPVVHDLGLDVTADTTGVAWWSPHQFIARLKATPAVTDQPSLFSPGPGWVTTVPSDFLHRQVWAGQLRDVAACPLWAPSALLFGKPAEVKVNKLPADVYGTPAALVQGAKGSGLTDDSWMILSELVEFTAEYRCFIAPGPDGSPTVVAASVYLVGDTTWDAWETAAQAPDPSEAAGFAQMVADSTTGPAGYVVDVGRLTDGTWAVVEANASWSSNPYHCDPAGVVASILAAQDPGNDPVWAWRSDPYMDRFARPLPVRGN